MKNEIINHCGSEPNKEQCGFVVVENEKLSVKPVTNRSSNPEQEFNISAQDFLYIKKNFEIVAVYHSHPEGEEKPSAFDVKMSELVCYPFLVFSIKNRNFGLYIPENNDANQEYLEKLIKEVGVK
jgi:proteasome lid subunit RPN8/RPN11